MALAITADGTKIPVGCGTVPPRTKTVVTALLADLVARGLSVADGLLVATHAEPAFYSDWSAVPRIRS